MIQLVDRLEAEHQRWVAVLLENHRGCKRGFKAMRGAVADNPAKASKRRGARGRLGVIRQPVQIALHCRWRSQLPDETPLGRALGWADEQVSGPELGRLVREHPLAGWWSGVPYTPSAS